MPTDDALPAPPALAGHIWRPARHEDAAAMRELYLACDRVTGGSGARLVSGYEGDFDRRDGAPETDSLVAVDPAGRLAALAWVEAGRTIGREQRAQLDGAVHPDYRRRGLGDFLLRWMEARAQQIFATQPPDHELVLRIDFTGTREDAVALYERRGFEFSHAAEVMRRDLALPIPDHPLPEGMVFTDWAPEQSHLMFEVYQQSFSDRPRGAGWSEPAWQSAFLGATEFRPDCSLLVMQGPEAVAFAVGMVDANENEHQVDTEGWIAQIGVRPQWRRRGLASALLCEIMRRLKAAGLDYAALDVNVNNPTALAVYRRLGFEVIKRFTTYEKSLRIG